MRERVTRLLVAVGVVALLTAWLVTVVLWQRYTVDPFSDHFRFEAPIHALLLLGPLALFFVEGPLKLRSLPRFQTSRASSLPVRREGPRARFRHLPAACVLVGLVLVVLASMKPQSIHAREDVEVHGIDIALVLDLSLSMEASDIRPNRFVAMQEVVDHFVTMRPNDRIGAVIFGREAFTLLPLTTDHAALRLALSELRLGMIDGRGTAIGNALGTGLNRLKRSEAETRVIILLTDGDSNSGNVSPEQAAAIAQSLEVKVYTILMGSPDSDGSGGGVSRLFGGPSFPVNPELLERIAESTGGEFFLASDRGTLERSFHSILDRLERSRIEDPGKIYSELYPAFLFPALALFMLAALGEGLVYRRWP
jgi:Ca-activated chloride channel homolog